MNRIVGAAVVAACVAFAGGAAQAQQTVNIKGQEAVFFIGSSDDEIGRSAYYVPTKNVTRGGDYKNGYFVTWPLFDVNQPPGGAWQLRVYNVSTLCQQGKPTIFSIVAIREYDGEGKETYRSDQVRDEKPDDHSPLGQSARLACAWDGATLKMARDGAHFPIPDGPRAYVFKDYREHSAALVAAWTAFDEMRAGHVQRLEGKMSKPIRHTYTVDMPKSWISVKAGRGTGEYGLSEHLTCAADGVEIPKNVTSDQKLYSHLMTQSLLGGGEVKERSAKGRTLVEVIGNSGDNQILLTYIRSGQQIAIGAACKAPRQLFDHFLPAFRAIADSVSSKN